MAIAVDSSITPLDQYQADEIKWLFALPAQRPLMKGPFVNRFGCFVLTTRWHVAWLRGIFLGVERGIDGGVL